MGCITLRSVLSIAYNRLSDQQRAILILIYEQMQKPPKEPPKPEDPFYIPKGYGIRAETVSVSMALARLRSRGLIKWEYREGYILTEEGDKVASELYKQKEAIVAPIRQIWEQRIKDAKEEEKRRRKEDKEKAKDEKREARKENIKWSLFRLRTG